MFAIMGEVGRARMVREAGQVGRARMVREMGGGMSRWRQIRDERQTVGSRGDTSSTYRPPTNPTRIHHDETRIDHRHRTTPVLYLQYAEERSGACERNSRTA